MARKVNTAAPATTGEKQSKDTRFKPGQSGNPKGRPKGSRNKLSEDFLTALAEDFEAHGVAAIRTMRKKSPAQYVRMVADLMPKDLNVSVIPHEEALRALA